ncbi:MAG: tetratricopeptide repeat protein [Hyphomicrobiaceae bacterium]
MAIKLAPDSATYLNYRAQSYVRSGRIQQGLADIEAALTLLPDDPRLLNTRGEIFEALGQRDDAISDYRQALKHDPSAQPSKDGLIRLGVR